MQNANTLEAMEVARQLILVLKGTVESLQMNLSQERDDNEGLKLTIESLEDENARLQEELFKVQAGAVEEKDTAKENQAEAIEAIGEKLANFELQIHLRGGKHRESLFHVIAFLFLAATRFEEFRKHVSTLARKHARLNFKCMVEPRIRVYRIQ